MPIDFLQRFPQKGHELLHLASSGSKTENYPCRYFSLIGVGARHQVDRAADVLVYETGIRCDRDVSTVIP